MDFTIATKKVNENHDMAYCCSPHHENTYLTPLGSECLIVSVGYVGEMYRVYYCEGCIPAIWEKIRTELDPKLKAFK